MQIGSDQVRWMESDPPTGNEAKQASQALTESLADHTKRFLQLATNLAQTVTLDTNTKPMLRELETELSLLAFVRSRLQDVTNGLA